MTIEEVRQIISNSKFDAVLKNRLVLLLPRLGKYTLSGLGKEVSRGDSLIIADYLVSLWENFASLLENLKNKDENSINNRDKFLTEKLSIFNGEDELYVLNCVLDVRTLADRNQASLTVEQYKQLFDFEIRLFWQLPKDEVLFLLRNNILYLLKKINLLKDTQVAVYKNDWDSANNFNKVFLDSLSQNKEVLGVKVPKTVGVWIRDFSIFTLPTGSQGSTFGLAEFLSRDPSVKKLTNAERESLSEILKLYVWFLDPIMDEDDVRNYIESISAKEPKQSPSYLNQQKFVLPESAREDFLQQSPLPKSPPSLYQSSNSGTGQANPTADKSLLGNKKAAPFGAALGSQLVPESPALTSVNSIADNKILSSGGPKGNRTPETRMSKPGSAPAWAHLNPLHHKNVPQPPFAEATGGLRPANIQDILKKAKGISFAPQNLTQPSRKASDCAKASSDKLTGANTEVLKKQMEERQRQTATSLQLSPQKEREKKQEEIDRKLEELRNRAGKN